MIPTPVARPMPPDDSQLRAVAFAALAEGCILALPAHLLLDTAFPAFLFAILFLAAFVVGTTVLCRYRSAPNAAVIAAVAVMLVALLAGSLNLHDLILRLLVAGVLGFRAISLGMRDWHRPLHDEIRWGALAIGVVAVIGTGSDLSQWRVPLAIMIPVFFAASLASRGVTIWHAPEADPADAGSWLGRLPAAFGAYVVGVLCLAAAALRGGIFERLGSILKPIGAALLTGVLFALDVVFSPIVWLISRAHVDTAAWERYLQNLGRSAPPVSMPGPSHGAFGGSIFRILGVVVFAGLAWWLYRVLRKMRPPEAKPPSGIERAPVASRPLPDAEAPTGRWRRQLPADQVRRWYAQVLLALERRQITKDPSLTPAEFARDVGRTLPELRDHLDPLTRAYEDVRYGSLGVDDVTIRELRAHHRALIAALRRLPGGSDPAGG